MVLNRERGKCSSPQPNLLAGASHWLKPDGSWQTKDPADKVFKDQDPGTWNKIERQQMHLGGGWAGTNRE